MDKSKKEEILERLKEAIEKIAELSNEIREEDNALAAKIVVEIENVLGVAKVSLDVKTATADGNPELGELARQQAEANEEAGAEETELVEGGEEPTPSADLLKDFNVDSELKKILDSRKGE